MTSPDETADDETFGNRFSEDDNWGNPKCASENEYAVCPDCFTVHDDDEDCAFECPVCGATLIRNARMTALDCVHGCGYHREDA